MVKKLKIKNSTLQSRQVESTVLRKFHYFKLFFFWFCFNIEHIRHALTTSTSTPFSCISSPWNHQIFSTNPVKSGSKEVLFKWATTQLRVVIIIIIIIVHLQNTGEVIVFAACGEGTHMLGWEGFHHGTTNSSNKKAFRNTPVFLKRFFWGGLCVHAQPRNLIFTTSGDWSEDFWNRMRQKPDEQKAKSLMVFFEKFTAQIYNKFLRNGWLQISFPVKRRREHDTFRGNLAAPENLASILQCVSRTEVFKLWAASRRGGRQVRQRYWKGAGACRKLVVAADWTAHQHGQQVALQRWQLMDDM